tara:strand:+ start:573 stop:710 length:138 start_codon:yes stop_codon:yes gene_type:complete
MILVHTHLEALRDELQKAHLDYYSEHVEHIIELLNVDPEEVLKNG